MIYNLESCVWEITLGCCFSCKYCGSKGGKAREGELTTEECIRVAKELYGLGCKRVSLIGGEVFMRPDWDIIAGTLTGFGIAVNIITNGFLFSEDIIRKIKELQVESVAVSIDGPRSVHDKYRQAGSFDRAVNAIKTLTRAEIPVSVISTLNKENSLYLEEFYQMLASLGIFAWQLQACSPMGNAASGGIDIDISFPEIIKFVEKHAPDAPFMLGIADNIGYFSFSEGMLRGNLSGKAFFGGCRAGISSIGIDSAGNVRGCESMYDEKFNEGNLRSKTIREIWENPEGFSYNRSFDFTMLSGKCKDCRYGIYCRGGCRSYNYFTTGELYNSIRCGKEE